MAYLPPCVLAYLLSYLHTCLFAYLHTYAPAFFLIYLPTYHFASLSAFLLVSCTSSSACSHASSAYSHTYLRTSVFIFRLTYLSADSPANFRPYLHTYTRAWMKSGIISVYCIWTLTLIILTIHKAGGTWRPAAPHPSRQSPRTWRRSRSHRWPAERRTCRDPAPRPAAQHQEEDFIHRQWTDSSTGMLLTLAFI